MNIIQEVANKIKQIMHNYNIIFYALKNNCLCRSTKFWALAPKS